MATKDKLNLDLGFKAKKKEIKRFNTEEALLDMVDETKRRIILHPAGTKLLIGAKDSGKTHLVKVDEIWKMEQDPMASGVATRKYSTSAAKRLGASFAKTLIRIKQKGYKFPVGYKKSQNFFYRLTSKSNMMENQMQEYASFEDENGLAGIDVQNGGYFATVHIEEPALKDDTGETPTPKQWNASLGVIKDSVNRTVRDYKATNPFHPPFKTTWWITMNDWDEDHPESDYAQTHAPREEFLRMQFAGMDPEMLLGNRDLIIKHWKNIAQALINNHTWMVYVKEDDKLIVRMTKLANPQLRDDPEEQKYTLMNIQKALIINDNFELARQLGMLYEGSSDDAFAYNIENLQDNKVVTEDYLKDKTILGRSISWDIDVNRRLTPTITLAVARLWESRNTEDSKTYMDEARFVTLKQEPIKAYGRGIKGENTHGYYRAMAEYTTALIKQYPIKVEQFGSHLTFDDDRGPWMDGVVRYLEKMLPQDDQEKINLHFQGKSGKDNGIIARMDTIQTILDEGVGLVDKHNRDLFEFISGARKAANGKRIEKGKYEKLADFINSYEGSMYPFIATGIADAFLNARVAEEEFY